MLAALLVLWPLASPAQAQELAPVAPGGREEVQIRSLTFGLKLWLRADVGVDANLSNQVETWRDQSGVHNHLAQTDGEMRPKLDRFGINGVPAIRFDGNDFLERQTGMPTGSYTKVAVVSIEDLSFNNNILSGASNHALFFGMTDKAKLFHGGTFASSTVGAVVDTPVVIIATFDENTGVGRLFQDGTLVGWGIGPVNTDSALQVGAFANANQLRGKIGEIAVYDRVLSKPERCKLERHLFQKFVQPTFPEADFTELARHGKIFARDSMDMAAAHTSGEVTSLGYDTIRVELRQDGLLFDQDSAALVYTLDVAPFSLSVDLVAGLFDYELEVILESGGTPTTVALVENLACGDLFLIQGQSNALAGDYQSESLGNQSQSPWIRSFGTSTFKAGSIEFDLDWGMADGELFNMHATIGTWALRMAEVLVTDHSMPIGILNGSEGGTTVSQHQRNDVDPDDTSTIYGRLLYRSQESNFENARFIAYYQGEFDASDPMGWTNGFMDLYDDWKVDYPALEQVYLFQVRSGCGVQKSDGIREAQRVLPALYTDVGLMSTTGVPGHDGCHFFYAGYREIGDRIARLVARDIYGSLDTHEITPPDVLSAKWTSGMQDEIEIEFVDPDDSLAFQLGSEAYFCTDDTGVSVTSGMVVGNKIFLQLSGSSVATVVGYAGHPMDGPWVLNGRGVGALSFKDFPISPARFGGEQDVPLQ